MGVGVKITANKVPKWQSGTIVEVWFREDGRVSPYLVAAGNQRFIVPQDSDDSIRHIDTFPAHQPPPQKMRRDTNQSLTAPAPEPCKDGPGRGPSTVQCPPAAQAPPQEPHRGSGQPSNVQVQGRDNAGSTTACGHRLEQDAHRDNVAPSSAKRQETPGSPKPPPVQEPQRDNGGVAASIESEARVGKPIATVGVGAIAGRSDQCEQMIRTVIDGLETEERRCSKKKRAGDPYCGIHMNARAKAQRREDPTAA